MLSPALRAQPLRWLYLPTLAATAVATALVWHGARSFPEPRQLIHQQQVHYCGPAVLTFVAVVLLAEQLWPVERRPVLARGHRMDLAYLVA